MQVATSQPDICSMSAQSNVHYTQGSDDMSQSLADYDYPVGHDGHQGQVYAAGSQLPQDASGSGYFAPSQFLANQQLSAFQHEAKVRSPSYLSATVVCTR